MVKDTGTGVTARDGVFPPLLVDGAMPATSSSGVATRPAQRRDPGLQEIPARDSHHPLQPPAAIAPDLAVAAAPEGAGLRVWQITAGE